MPKADKEAFVKVIYSLPNKVFFLWASEADKEVDDIVQFFREQSQDYYARQKKLSDDDLIRVLQWASMSFLLDLYNLPVVYATKDSTIPYLSSFNYNASDTYLQDFNRPYREKNFHGACQTSQVCRYYLCTLATLLDPGGTCTVSL